MNDKLKAVFGVGFAGFIALVAMYGKPFLDALQGLPLVLQAFAKSMPLGVGSFFMSLALAGFSYEFAVRWLPCRADGRRPYFAAETVALVVGVAVTCVLQGRGAAPAMLKAVMLGILAGYAAPWIAKGVESIVVMRACATTEKPDAP